MIDPSLTCVPNIFLKIHNHNENTSRFFFFQSTEILILVVSQLTEGFWICVLASIQMVSCVICYSCAVATHCPHFLLWLASKSHFLLWLACKYFCFGYVFWHRYKWFLVLFVILVLLLLTGLIFFYDWLVSLIQNFI